MTLDLLQLDWGAATVDSINDERRTAVHVFNHELGTPGCEEERPLRACARCLVLPTPTRGI